MWKRVLCFVVAALSLAGAAQAAPAPPKSVILVYDVTLREFTCWREGAFPSGVKLPFVCDSKTGWHRVTPELYFTRGEAVSVWLVNGTALDLFSVDVSAADLAEPTPAVQGSFAEAPKVVSLSLAPRLVTAPGAQLAGSTPTVKASQLYRLLSTSSAKDLKAWLTAQLLEPANSDDVGALLGADLTGAITRLTGKYYATDVANRTIQAQNIAQPQTTHELIDRTRELTQIIESTRAFYAHLDIMDAPAAGQTINTVKTLLDSKAVRAAGAVDLNDLNEFVDAFSRAFPVETRYRCIDGLELQNDPKTHKPTGRMQIQPADASLCSSEPNGKFVNRIVDNAPSQRMTADSLKLLKANLAILADALPDLEQAQHNYAEIATVLENFKTHSQSADSVFALQNALDTLALTLIDKAQMLNHAASVLPLESDVLPIGQWFASKTVTIKVKQGQRAPLFDVSAVAGVAPKTVVEAKAAAEAKPIHAAAGELTEVRTIEIPVYNTYRLQMGIGAAYSSANDTDFVVTKVTTGSGDSAKTENFVDQTVSKRYNVLWTASLVIFPVERHAFPQRPRYAGEKLHSQWSNVGGVIGFSVTEPTRNIFLGAAWFPQRNLAGIQLAWHIALRDVPPGGDGASLTQRVTSVERKRFNGVSVGFILSSDFFSKTFQAIFKP